MRRAAAEGQCEYAMQCMHVLEMGADWHGTGAQVLQQLVHCQETGEEKCSVALAGIQEGI